MTIQSIYIGGKRYTEFSIYPLKDDETLDESLDQSTLTLTAVSEEMPFDRLIDVEIVVADEFGNTKSISREIANDKVEEIILYGEKKYKHTLILIEKTKEFERYFIDTKTITNALDAGREFTYSTRVVDGAFTDTLYSRIKNRPVSKLQWNTQDGFYYKEISTDRNDVPVISDYYTPRQATTSTTFKSPYSFFNNEMELSPSRIINCYMAILKNGKVIYKSIDNSAIDYVIPSITEGTYTVVYVGDITLNTSVTALNLFYRKYVVQYSFEVVQSASTLTIPPPYTIADVVGILCDSVKPLYEAETPRFSLDDEQFDWLADIKSPEFSFTKETLWEALLAVGGYIHAIPRLINGNKIHFDKLGQNNKFEIPEKYYIKNYSADIENYCTELDTNVDNMMFNDESNVVSIVDPDPQMARSTRTEDGNFRITEDDCFLWSALPIYEVKHLWICDVNIGTTQNPNYQTYDIGQYVYENAEYEALSSYSGNFPWSKNYALYFTQGERHIRGLNLRSQNSVISVFNYYAIYNILNKITNVSASQLSDANNLTKLMFRIEYVPLISARLKQRKPVWKAGKKSILAYNQTENTISGSFYGEKMRGAVAKLGNIEKTLTFATKNLRHIPKVGDLIEGKYYVMEVTTEYLPEFCNVTCVLCEDYNKISEYIGLSSNRRYYEVSEKQSVDRSIILEDVCLVSHELNENLNDTSMLAMANGVVLMSQAFQGQNLQIGSEQYDNANITSVFVESGGYYQTENPKVILPCVATSFGNSLAISWQFDDNYSAGPHSTPDIYNTNTARTQTYTPYGDEFGRISYADLIFFSKNDYLPEIDDDILAPNNTLHAQRLLQGYSLPANDGDTVEERVVFLRVIAAFSDITATINKNTFNSYVATNTSGVLNFVYSNGGWKLNGNAVNLALYGVTVTGTPQQNNIIEIEYYAKASRSFSNFNVLPSVYPIVPYSAIKINKDSRERISMSYQLHFQTLDANMIVGEGLTKDNILIKEYDNQKYLKMYVLPYEITKWQKEIDLTNATLVKDFSQNGGITNNRSSGQPKQENTWIKIPSQTATADGLSYVLVENGTNTLVIGENMAIKTGDTIPEIYLQFTHDID